jgi:hypothetical protein
MDNIEQKIMAGELPEEFLEKYEIVPEENLLSREVAAKIDQIVRRLLGDAYDPQLHNFRYLLSASAVPNAFVIPNAHPPIMTVTQSLLNLLPSEDHLAAVIAHELTHKRLEEHLGEHANSKLEELGGDTFGLLLLHDAGYRAKAMPEMLKLLNPLEEKDIRERFNAYIDVHPNTPLRIQNAETAVVVLGNKRGKDAVEQRALTPKTEAFWSELQAFRQPRYIQRRLAEEGFAEADTLRKIDIVRHLLATEKLDPEDPYRGQRVKDLMEAVNALNIDRNNRREAQAVDELTDFVCERKADPNYGWYQTAGQVFKALTQKYQATLLPEERLRFPTPMYPENETPTDPAPGHVGELAWELHQFMAATDSPTATGHAEKAVALYNQINPLLKTSKHTLDVYNDLALLPRFTLPSANNVKEIERLNAAGGPIRSLPYPWQRHIEWAKEAVTTNQAPVIQLTLALLGINEDYGTPKIANDQAPLYEQKYGQDWTYYDLPHALTSPLWSEYQKRELAHTPEGHIQGYRLVERPWPGRFDSSTPQRAEALRQSETRWLAQKDLEGQAASLAADWSLWGPLPYTRDFDEVLAKEHVTDDTLLSWELNDLDWYRASPFYDSTTLSDRRVKRVDIQRYETLELKERMNAFVEANKEVILPQISIRDGGDAFQKDFTTKCQARLAEDPDLFRPILQAFFSGDRTVNARVALERNLPSMLENAVFKARSDNVYLDVLNVQEMSLGISPTHPYVGLVASSALGLAPNQRVPLLAYTRYLNDDKKQAPTQRWAYDPVAALGLPPTTSTHELAEIYKLAKNEIRDFETLQSVHDVNRKAHFLSNLMATELYRVAENKTRFMTRDELALVGKAREMTLLSDMLPSVQKSIDEQLRRTAAHEIAASTSNAALIESYVQYDHFRLFMNQPDTRQRYEKAIVKRLENVKDAAEKRRLCEQILLERQLSPSDLPDYATKYQSSIADPVFRNTIVEAYIDSLGQLYGHDDGSPAYEAKLRPLIDDLLARTSGAQRFMLLSGLATRLETQRTLSFYIRDQLQANELSSLASYNNLFRLGEASIDMTANNASIREGTIDFLSTPLTEKSVHTYILAVQKEATSEQLLPWQAGALSNALEKGGDAINPEIKNEAVRQIHRNFWALPLELRVFYFQNILFPPEKNTPEMFERTKELVLNKCFPPSEPPAKPKNLLKRLFTRSAKSSKTSAIARDIVEAYLSCGDIPEQRVLLTAMLVANEPQTNKNEGYGKSLKSILYALGPAGVKMAQAIQSHPATPKDIRKDLEETKFNASPPFRWTIFSMLDKLGLGDKIARVGKILGAGSYGVTIEAQRPNKPASAITMLRDDVRPQAASGFKTFMQTCEKLIQKHPTFKPLRAMIKQAQKMSVVETDMDLAEWQARFGERLYNVGVKVDDYAFHFKSAPWIGHDKDYKETQIMPGAPFLKLPTKTRKQRAYKKAVAKAVLLVELRVIMAGRPSDHDRHGGQQAIAGDQIGMFDHGAMSLKAPSDEHKHLLGHVLGRALRRPITSLGRTSVADALVQEIDRQAEKPANAEFMTEVKRAFLSLANYTDELSPKETAAIFAQALTSSDVHPSIRQGLKQGLGLFAPLYLGVKGRFGLLRSKASTVKIDLNKNDRALPQKEKPAKIHLSVAQARANAQTTDDDNGADAGGGRRRSAGRSGSQRYKKLHEAHVDHFRQGKVKLSKLSSADLKKGVQQEVKAFVGTKTTPPAKPPKRPPTSGKNPGPRHLQR